MSIHGKWTEATVNPTSWCRRKKVLFQTKFHPRLCRAAVTAAHSAPAAVFLQAPEKYRRSQFQEEARRHRGRHYSDWQLTREKIEPPPASNPTHTHTYGDTHRQNRYIISIFCVLVDFAWTFVVFCSLFCKSHPSEERGLVTKIFIYKIF